MSCNSNKPTNCTSKYIDLKLKGCRVHVTLYCVEARQVGLRMFEVGSISVCAKPFRFVSEELRLL